MRSGYEKSGESEELVACRVVMNKPAPTVHSNRAMIVCTHRVLRLLRG